MDISIASLRYRILDGQPDLRPLRILQTRSLAWAGWNVTFSVLGASHAVTFSRPGAAFVEAFTCAPRLASAAALLDLPGAAPCSPQASVHGVEIRCAVTPFPLDDGDELLGAYPPGARLDQSFPASGSRIPVTRIGWRVHGGDLLVETVHAYPEEGRGVRTRTAFEAGRKRAVTSATNRTMEESTR